MSFGRTNYTQYEMKVFTDLKQTYPQSVISPSHLRIENKIVNAKQAYDFPVLMTGSEVSTEVKLDKNDLFRVTRMSMFVYQRNVALADEGIQPLQTYPNASYFTTGTAWVKSHLETLYNGRLTIKRGTTVILENFNTRNFREVSITQQTGATNASSQNLDAGTVQLVPAFNLPGREQVSIQGLFPTFSGILWASDAAGLENRVVMMLQGFLVKGANI